MGTRCFDLLSRCFDAFDGEEESVKEEHAALIAELQSFIEVPRSIEPSRIDQHRFYNACMSLMNIDMHELVEAGVIAEGNFDRGGSSWKRFNDEPLLFLAKIDDRKRDALWQLLEARQLVADPKPAMLAALEQAESFVAGFEGDELQEGIDDLLETMRDAIEQAKGE